jgi:hypothetical protein
MRSIFTALAAVALAGYGCVEGQATGSEGSARDEDLAALPQWIASEASFEGDMGAAANARIQALLAGPGPGTEAERYLEVASVVALADNGHSNVWAAPVYDMGILPLRTYWFSDGLYVVRARTEHAELVGARIDSIGGVAIDDVVEVFSEYHGGHEGHLKSYFTVPWMISPVLLHAAGLGADPARARLSVTLQSGTTRVVDLGVDVSGQSPVRTAPWVRLLDAELIGESGEWSFVQPAGERLLTLRDARSPFRYVYLPDAGVAYLQLRSNIDQNGISVRDFAGDVEEYLRRDRPGAIILDNRFNGGGDLTRTADLALKLPGLVPESGRVYVLTSNATFSAGIYTSFYPKAADPVRTIVVGEHVGDRSRFFAESEGAFVLPASGWRISQSLELHDLGDGCPDRDRCHLGGRGKLDIAVGSLAPDLEVAWTFEDFMAGRDPVLEYALRAASRSGLPEGAGARF